MNSFRPSLSMSHTHSLHTQTTHTNTHAQGREVEIEKQVSQSHTSLAASAALLTRYCEGSVDWAKYIQRAPEQSVISSICNTRQGLYVASAGWLMMRSCVAGKSKVKVFQSIFFLAAIPSDTNMSHWRVEELVKQLIRLISDCSLIEKKVITFCKQENKWKALLLIHLFTCF